MKSDKNKIFSVITILLLIVLFEITLQIYFRVKNGIWLWQKKFNVHYVVRVNDRRQYALKPSYHKNNIYINQYGFRDIPNKKYRKEIKANKLLCNLGDSVPFGFNINYEETYSYFLQKDFDIDNLNITVINAGVPSYNLRQSFDRLRYDILSKNWYPEVITIEAANDISLLTFYRERWNPDVTWAHTRYKISKGIIKKVQNFLINQRISGIIYSTGFFLVKLRQFFFKNEAEEHFYFSPDKMLSHIEKTLDKELKFCLDNKIKVILLPINPFYYQSIKKKSKNKDLKYYNSKSFILWFNIVQKFNDVLIEKSLQYENVYFLDTIKILDKYDRSDLYVDWIHRSGKGNKIVADSLYNFILKKNLLDR